MRASSVLYTAISGSRDSLQAVSADTSCAHVAFCDVAAPREGWVRIELDDRLPPDCRGLDSNRRAKWFKLHPHLLFPEHDVSIWVDGNVTVTSPLDPLIEEILSGPAWAAFPHRVRDCAFDEAAACALSGKDDPVAMFRQVARYFASGYPRHHGLAENTVLVRRHQAREVIELNSRWWREILDESHRDQLSFDYCCWREGMSWRRLSGTVYQNPFFAVRSTDSGRLG